MVDRPHNSRSASATWGFDVETRVATGEDQSESVISDLLDARRGIKEVIGDEEVLDTHAEISSSHEINGAPPRDGCQPRTWVGRNPVTRPGRQRSGVRVLDTFLGDVDVARHAQGRREDEGPTLVGELPRPPRRPAMKTCCECVSSHRANRANLDAAELGGESASRSRAPRRGRVLRRGSSRPALPWSRRTDRRSRRSRRPHSCATSLPWLRLRARCHRVATRRCSRRSSCGRRGCAYRLPSSAAAQDASFSVINARYSAIAAPFGGSPTEPFHHIRRTTTS